MKESDLSSVEVVDFESIGRAIDSVQVTFELLYPLWRGHSNIDYKLQAEVVDLGHFMVRARPDLIADAFTVFMQKLAR